MTTVQIRVDERLRAQAQAVAQEMGLDLSTAVRLFLTQMVRENGLPFRPTADPFFSVKNQEHLARVAADLNNNRHCSTHSLIEN